MPPLYEVDFESAGFEWIDWGDRDNSVLSWIRRDRKGRLVICVSNFTPVVREGYRLGVPDAGEWNVLVNTDDERWNGSGAGPKVTLSTVPTATHARDQSVVTDLPPLATLMLIRAWCLTRMESRS